MVQAVASHRWLGTPVPRDPCAFEAASGGRALDDGRLPTTRKTERTAQSNVHVARGRSYSAISPDRVSDSLPAEMAAE